ncbi:MAG: acetoacetate decarboxylase family protein [Candidatus Thorarchaeota archaeon]
MGSKVMKGISEEEAIEMQLGPNESRNPVFLFKHFPSQDASGFDYQPRLIRGDVAFSRKSIAVGHGSIKLESTKYDPWGEVEVVKILGATYTIQDSSMLKGEVLAEVESESFKPHSYLKWD